MNIVLNVEAIGKGIEMKKKFIVFIALSFMFCGGNVNPQPPNPAICILPSNVISQIGILSTVNPKMVVCELEVLASGKIIRIVTFYPCGTGYADGNDNGIIELKTLVIRGVDITNNGEIDYSEITLSTARPSAEKIDEYIGMNRSLLLQKFGKPNIIVKDALEIATAFINSADAKFISEEELIELLNSWIFLSLEQCSGVVEKSPDERWTDLFKRYR